MSKDLFFKIRESESELLNIEYNVLHQLSNSKGSTKVPKTTTETNQIKETKRINK